MQRFTPLPGGEGRGEGERSATELCPAALDEILYKLKGLVLKHVTRLHHRKENFILSNAEDLVPVQIDDDDFISPIEKATEGYRSLRKADSSIVQLNRNHEWKRLC